MKQKNVKNTVDSAHPYPAGVEHLSEKEKKQLEISGRLEHSHGSRGEDLSGEEGESSGVGEETGAKKQG